MSDTDVVARLRCATVARHRGWYRLPIASRRRLTFVPHLQFAAFQHHRGDNRTEVQQIRFAAQFGNVRLICPSLVTAFFCLFVFSLFIPVLFF